MDSKKNKKNPIDDLSILFDVEDADSSKLQTGPVTQARENQALKAINYLDIENKRLESLYKFLDTPLSVQKNTKLIEYMIKDVNFELLNMKTEVYSKLARDASPLFQNIEFLWEKTFL